MGKKYQDISWDFRNENTKIYTHCFHNYPAMMIPQVAGRIIEKYGKNSKILFDPYCGTGTSLVEANLRNINAIGTDLNPLARLIAAVKTTSINLKTLDLYLKDFYDKSFTYKFGINSNFIGNIPNFMNINYWFSKDVQLKLSIIKDSLDKIDDLSIKNFFKVAFSETVREGSWTKNSEFKLLRMSPKQIEYFEPDVFGIMELKLSKNRKGLISYLNSKHNGSNTKVYSFNTVTEIPRNIIPENYIDLVVTSPPYGDSKTTVAYGQFSRLANQWLGFENASKLDNELMGGKKAQNAYCFEIDILDEIIESIKKQDDKRSKDVISFYKDYEKSIRNISKVVKKKGHICYVVGNRSVKRITIPNDEITKNFFERYNFKHIETIIRNIPNKRMPSENSPSNVKGKKSPTMKNEYIVVCQK
ncbi:MAG: DNA methyltransferase [Promethearchaeota archaeon]